MLLGDAIEFIAKPIAKAIGLDCHDETGELKPESDCAKRKAWCNEKNEWINSMIKLGIERGVAKIHEGKLMLRADFSDWLKKKVTIKQN